MFHSHVITLKRFFKIQGRFCSESPLLPSKQVFNKKIFLKFWNWGPFFSQMSQNQLKLNPLNIYLACSATKPSEIPYLGLKWQISKSHRLFKFNWVIISCKFFLVWHLWVKSRVTEIPVSSLHGELLSLVCVTQGIIRHPLVTTSIESYIITKAVILHQFNVLWILLQNISGILHYGIGVSVYEPIQRQCTELIHYTAQQDNPFKRSVTPRYLKTSKLNVFHKRNNTKQPSIVILSLTFEDFCILFCLN